MKLDTLNDVYGHVAERNLPRLMLQKKQGQWQTISTGDFRSQVTAVAASLQKWGLRKADRAAILSENRPEWQVADFACLLQGMIDVPIYPTLTGEQAARMLQNSGARVLFVSTNAHLQKLRPYLGQTAIERVVLMDDVNDDGASSSISFASLIKDAPNPEAIARIEREAREIRPEDPATIIYTSGTTGTPKGAVLSHGNVASNLRFSLTLFLPGVQDLAISFLPLSHITARHVDYAHLYHGVTLAYCPDIVELPSALLELRPTFMVAVPRVYEKLYSKVEHDAAHGMKQRIYRWALRTGEKNISATLAEKRPLNPAWRLANALLYSKIRKGFGGRVRAFISGGAPLGRELALWYAKVGICMYEGYGLTETSPVIAVNSPGAVKLGTVGKVLPNIDAKIAPDGELLVRGPNVFQGYWNAPQETAAAFEDGWFKTGDIAALDSEGFLTITDRKKDLIKTSGGKFIAPQPLETSLKRNPLVAQAAVLGDKRKFPAVLISPNFAALEEWARSQGLQFSSRAELVAAPPVRQKYEEIVEALNDTLARFEKLKKVLLVLDEFSIESGELTPSMKLKRRSVEEKYKNEIGALYATADQGGEVLR